MSCDFPSNNGKKKLQLKYEGLDIIDQITTENMGFPGTGIHASIHHGALGEHR